LNYGANVVSFGRPKDKKNLKPQNVAALSWQTLNLREKEHHEYRSFPGLLP